MSVLDGIRAWFSADPMQTAYPLVPMQTRGIDSFVDHPGLEEQLLRVQGLTPRPWRAAGIREALGVPAIFQAVTLIANVTGSLTLKAFRLGAELPDDQRPRLIIRPNPFTTTREFFRMTAYCMATRGEAWWWVGARDVDGQPLSLIPVNPAEVSVTEDPRDLRYPIIEWRGKRMANADMIQVPFMLEPGSFRGVGPLQMCGAAISVSVEAQEWAANFFASGGNPSTIIKSAVAMEKAEAQILKEQWVDDFSNLPKVIDPGIESVEQQDYNPQGAQMLEARNYQNSDAARMFSIPGSLLDAAISGSSLTYQNVGQEFDKWVRVGLLPNYLEPIEQGMSDLLTRATVTRFNTAALLRADIKTRWEVYEIASKVLPIDEAATLARKTEGLEAGDVEMAPVPLAPPQAIPASLPIQARSADLQEIRCKGRRVVRGLMTDCNRLLGKAAPPYEFVCPRCSAVAAA